MSRVLQISDPHFGTERPQVLQALVRFAREQQPKVTLLSGDITQRARRRQFDAAGAFVRQLPEPVLAVPGNHDIPLFNLPARLFHPYRNYRRVFGHELEPEYESAGLLALCLNTSRPERHKNGEVSSAQIERVACRLRAARPEQLRIVMQHHPVRAQEASDLSNLLIGQEHAVPTWVDAGLDLLLCGHIHLPYVRPLHGQESGRRAWTAQAGTALSTRVRGGIPNSVNLIVHDETQGRLHCCVERWDYSAREDCFVTARSETLHLDREA